MASGYPKFFKKIKEIQWLVFLIGLFITLIMGMTYIFKPEFLKLMEYKLYDTVLEKVHSKETANSVAIVDIDEYSLEKFGQWPWPRYRVALLLQKINMAGALAIGMDVLFGEPDGKSPIVLQQAIKKDLHLDIGFSGLPDGLMDNDALLARNLQKGTYVLGYSCSFNEGRAFSKNRMPPHLKVVELKEPGAKPPIEYLFEAQGLIPPLPGFLEGGTQAGFMNTVTDKDGILRRTPLMIGWQGNIYPNLSLATLLKALEGRVPPPVLKVTPGGIESLKIGKTIIPLQPNGAMMINYRGPSNTFPYISAGEILEDKVNPKEIAGKVIFLGTSAAGLKDLRVSPLDQVYPGVEVHATIVDNILSNEFIRRPDWIPGLEMVSIILWGLLITLMIGWANAWMTIGAALFLGFGILYGSIWTLKNQSIWISPFFPLMVLLFNFSILNMQKFWLSEQKKKFFREAFSKYVSRTVVDQLAKRPEKLSLEGEEKDISILFSDIRGFTSIAETLPPYQVTELLHDYFTPVTRIIIENQGTHDKFIGDAVMCFWNAPLTVEHHEQCALKAALEMLDALEEINRDFREKFDLEITIGIGLHSGVCQVGNMGSDDIFDYTIIGDSVNLASRLEGLTKFYGVPLILSESMLMETPADILVQELDLVRVMGKDEPIRIFTVYPVRDKGADILKREIEQHHSALAFYREKKFARAAGIFETLLQQHDGKKLYSIYQKRCVSFMETPPDETWDRVFSHTRK